MRQIFQFYRGMPTLYLSLVIHAVGTLVLSLACLPIPSKAHAAAPITPSGLNTQVGQPVTLPTGQTQYNVTGGTRPGGGTNLFHSFGDFNVPTNNIANFFNETGLPTSNILGRVTGGNISNIFGTIQTTNFGAANLFLMNPAGFLFGPNATINVGGMMAFTTADYMRLADGGRFNANLNATPPDVLTAAPVAAFGFLGSNPSAINFEGGQLTVAEGTGLTLVGGNISLMPDASGTPSSITAPGRPILLTSVAGPGEVAADTGIPAAGMALGTITLGQGTILSTAGDASLGDGSGGAVSIRGGQFVATGAQILTNPSSGTTGQSGAVTVTASDTVSFTDSTINTSSLFAGGGGAVTITGGNSVTLTRSGINTRSELSNGDGGAVSITASVVALEDAGIATAAIGDGTTSGSGGAVTLTGTTSVSLTRPIIDTTTFDTAGNSGPVTITGSTITIVGNPDTPSIDTSIHNDMGAPNAGNGGDITITGTNVTVSGSPEATFTLVSVADAIGTFSRGGNIRISGSENIVFNNGATLVTTTVSQGAAGNIELLGQHVTITQSNLFSPTLSPGPSGAITITGAGDVAIISGSVISTSAGAGSDGPAGPITINTPHLTISGGSQVASDTFGSGQGGTVTIQGTSGPAQSVLISDAGSGIFTDTGTITAFGPILGTGTGGNIFVNANSVTLQNGGALSAKTTGVGNAGDILVKADSVNIEIGGQITSSSSIRQIPFFEGEEIPSPTGNAGTVTIQGLASPAQSVLIEGAGSGIFTNTEGTGAGGNIFVNANSVTLQNGATVSASSTGQIENPGNAGSIDITATDGLTMQNNSKITTEAGQGAGGGNMKITTSPEATVWLQNSQMSASVADGPGGGGNISFDPQFVILQNSQILAQAAQGQGGAITIIAGLFLPDAISKVNADSGSGVNGTITIQSPNAPASGRIQPLGKTPLLPTSLLNQRCAALAGGNFSSFTVAGRDSLPAEPGSWLSSPLAMLGTGEGQGARSERREAGGVTDVRREAGGETSETPIVSLRQIAPPGFLTQAFAVDWSGCTS